MSAWAWLLCRAYRARGLYGFAELDDVTRFGQNKARERLRISHARHHQ